MRDTAMFAILFGGGGGQVTNKKKCMWWSSAVSQSQSVTLPQKHTLSIIFYWCTKIHTTIKNNENPE